MKKPTITVGRCGSFEMAHKLVGAVTKECNDTIHGHSYKWGIELTGEQNDAGMVIDYGELKSVMATITEVFDHSLWVPTLSDVEKFFTTNKKLLFMEGMNPTAENMCTLIMATLVRWPITSIRSLSKLKVWLKETEDSICSIEIPSDHMVAFLSHKTVFEFSNKVL